MKGGGTVSRTRAVEGMARGMVSCHPQAPWLPSWNRSVERGFRLPAGQAQMSPSRGRQTRLGCWIRGSTSPSSLIRVSELPTRSSIGHPANTCLACHTCLIPFSYIPRICFRISPCLRSAQEVMGNRAHPLHDGYPGIRPVLASLKPIHAPAVPQPGSDPSYAERRRSHPCYLCSQAKRAERATERVGRKRGWKERDHGRVGRVQADMEEDAE